MKVIKTTKYAEMAGRGVKSFDNSSDKVMLRQAIIGELDAISLYEQMANSTKNAKIKEVLLDIAKEEKVHVGELEELLEKTDDEQEESLNKGRKEVKGN